MQDSASEPSTGAPRGDMALSEAEFRDIYARIPRLTVEVIVESSQGILLTRRESGPCATGPVVPCG
jgi:hypothetical protein